MFGIERIGHALTQNNWGANNSLALDNLGSAVTYDNSRSGFKPDNQHLFSNEDGHVKHVQHVLSTQSSSYKKQFKRFKQSPNSGSTFRSVKYYLGKDIANSNAILKQLKRDVSDLYAHSKKNRKIAKDIIKDAREKLNKVANTRIHVINAPKHARPEAMRELRIAMVLFSNAMKKMSNEKFAAKLDKSNSAADFEFVPREKSFKELQKEGNWAAVAVKGLMTAHRYGSLVKGAVDFANKVTADSTTPSDVSSHDKQVAIVSNERQVAHTNNIELLTVPSPSPSPTANVVTNNNQDGTIETSNSQIGKGRVLSIDENDLSGTYSGFNIDLGRRDAEDMWDGLATSVNDADFTKVFNWVEANHGSEDPEAKIEIAVSAFVQEYTGTMPRQAALQILQGAGLTITSSVAPAPSPAVSTTSGPTTTAPGTTSGPTTAETTSAPTTTVATTSGPTTAGTTSAPTTTVATTSGPTTAGTTSAPTTTVATTSGPTTAGPTSAPTTTVATTSGPTTAGTTSAPTTTVATTSSPTTAGTTSAPTTTVATTSGPTTAGTTSAPTTTVATTSGPTTAGTTSAPTTTVATTSGPTTAGTTSAPTTTVATTSGPTTAGTTSAPTTTVATTSGPTTAGTTSAPTTTVATTSGSTTAGTTSAPTTTVATTSGPTTAGTTSAPTTTVATTSSPTTAGTTSAPTTTVATTSGPTTAGTTSAPTTTVATTSGPTTAGTTSAPTTTVATTSSPTTAGTTSAPTTTVATTSGPTTAGTTSAPTTTVATTSGPLTVTTTGTTTVDECFQYDGFEIEDAGAGASSSTRNDILDFFEGYALDNPGTDIATSLNFATDCDTEFDLGRREQLQIFASHYAEHGPNSELENVDELNLLWNSTLTSTTTAESSQAPATTIGTVDKSTPPTVTTAPTTTASATTTAASTSQTAVATTTAAATTIGTVDKTTPPTVTAAPTTAGTTSTSGATTSSSAPTTAGTTSTAGATTSSSASTTAGTTSTAGATTTGTTTGSKFPATTGPQIPGTSGDSVGTSAPTAASTASTTGQTTGSKFPTTSGTAVATSSGNPVNTAIPTTAGTIASNADTVQPTETQAGATTAPGTTSGPTTAGSTTQADTTQEDTTPHTTFHEDCSVDDDFYNLGLQDDRPFYCDDDGQTTQIDNWYDFTQVMKNNIDGFSASTHQISTVCNSPIFTPEQENALYMNHYLNNYDQGFDQALDNLENFFDNCVFTTTTTTIAEEDKSTTDPTTEAKDEKTTEKSENGDISFWDGFNNLGEYEDKHGQGSTWAHWTIIIGASVVAVAAVVAIAVIAVKAGRRKADGRTAEYELVKSSVLNSSGSSQKGYLHDIIRKRVNKLHIDNRQVVTKSVVDEINGIGGTHGDTTMVSRQNIENFLDDKGVKYDADGTITNHGSLPQSVAQAIVETIMKNDSATVEEAFKSMKATASKNEWFKSADGQKDLAALNKIDDIDLAGLQTLASDTNTTLGADGKQFVRTVISQFTTANAV